MSKHRLIFRKEGQAQYISHLDLMHTIQRAFQRAGIQIRHTEGFNPHPYMSIALPLSVGCESECELMDFDLEDDVPLTQIPERLNAVLPDGIVITAVYVPDTKLKEIRWLEVTGTLVYDDGISENVAESLTNLFSGDQLMISKRTKHGMGEMDIIPCIRLISFLVLDAHRLEVCALISAQDPSLNPIHIVSAISQHLPDLTPDFSHFKRVEVYNTDMAVFR
jgi:radical SAM-linked protein